MLDWMVSYTIRNTLPILGLAVFSSNLGNGIIAPLLPLYAEKLGASGVWLGIIYSGVAISSAAFMPFAGRISDRRGRKMILSIGLFAAILASFAYTRADSIISLTMVRFFQGAASAMIIPIAQAYIGDISPEGQEGRWMGIFNATFIAGFGLGPLMGGVLADYFGMNAAFYAMGSLNLMAFLGVTLFLREVIKRKATLTHLSYRGILASRVTRGIFSYQAGVSANRGIMTTFLPIFASIYIGLTPSLIGMVLTVVIIGNSLLLIPAGALADKYNKRYLVIVGCLGIAFSMLLVPQARSLGILLVFLALGSIFDALAMPPAMAMIVQEGRKYGMGTAAAISYMGMGLGMGLAPILAGLVVDLVDARSAFYVCSAAVFLGASLFGQFTRGPFTKKEKYDPNYA
jgi:DHA1 family multidrug resistance protein-like MFS transporter